MEPLFLNPFVRCAVEVRKPFDTRWRCAPDFRLFYFLSKSCPMGIGEESYTPEEGDIAFIPAGTPYCFYDAGTLHCISINFDLTHRASSEKEFFVTVDASEFDKSMLVEREDISAFPAFLSRPMIRRGGAHYRSHFDTLLEEHARKEPLGADVASAVLKLLLLSLGRDATRTPKSKELDALLSYIREHCEEGLDNGLLAQRMGYHPNHLNRLIRAHTGMTVHQYLIFCRIERARRLLTETELSVAEVAAACGYGSLCNFSADFKKKTGASPLSYRTRARFLL